MSESPASRRGGGATSSLRVRGGVLRVTGGAGGDPVSVSLITDPDAGPLINVWVNRVVRRVSAANIRRIILDGPGGRDTLTPFPTSPSPAPCSAGSTTTS